MKIEIKWISLAYKNEEVSGKNVDTLKENETFRSHGMLECFICQGNEHINTL